ncbi:hypothetical protein VNI00_003818 [Paramarasmius palmivorus]|uniref:Uncharacterized protein n=1 Tax=Paramarasmius palmivorus TaxID=297713 RepID=A0AAW0DP76_9AGAR
MVVAGVSGYVLAGQDKVHYPVQSGCHVGISRQTALRIAGLWMTLFVYDTIIFALTASRTYQFWREFNLGSLSLGVVNRPSLFSLFFRDGAMYFAVMALANLANILTFYLGGPFMRGGLSSFASWYYLGDNALSSHAELAYDGYYWIVYPADVSDLES